MARIVTRMLSCGMPLIIEPMSGVKSIGINWLIPAGSATDPDAREGLAPMLAELVFRGAGDLDSRAQADAMDRLGVSRSCEPGSHHLRLGFALTGDRVFDALKPISDMVVRPRMDEDSIEPTRDLALQAIESLADDPHQRAIIAARARHNDWPFNRSGLGSTEGLRAITRADLLDHWRERVRPASAGGGGGSILAIAGDIPESDVDRLTSHLDGLLKGWTGTAPSVVSRPSLTKGSYEHVQDQSTQAQIVLVHDAPPEKHADARLERVVSNVLSGGMSCRLFSEVREKRGLCYSVSQSYATDRDFGRCLAYVGTTPERAQESLDVLVAELARINSQAGAVTDDEFQRAQIGIKANIIFSGESTGARASALATDYHRLGRARPLDEIAQQYAALTRDQVNAYLARRKVGPATIVTLGPAPLKRPV
jgi:predicted Zn-dependent peptidase